MKITTGIGLLCITALVALSACGGGTSSSEPEPTKATVTLSSAVTGSLPVNAVIGGYDATFTLPAGVTVKSTVNPPLTDDGVVSFVSPTTGPSILVGIYTAATASAPGTLRVVAIDTDGFDQGDFAVVHGNIQSGYHPRSTDFSQPTYTVSAEDGNDLTSECSISIRAVIR